MNDQTITLTRIYNPMDHSDKDHIQWSFRPGDTVAHVLDNTGAIISDRETVKFAVSLNGVQVPADQYDSTYLMPGQQLVVVPYLHGGGGGVKDILRMVGMVVLTIVASIVSYGVVGGMVLGGYLSSSIGIYATYAIVFGSIMIAGSMALNAMLPGAQAQSPALNGFGSSDQSQSYSWNPQTTQQQGIPIAKRYGLTKITGNVSGVYRESIADKQYINVLISLGEGPISAPYDIKLNGQPIENYTGVTSHVRLGFLNQDLITNFDDTYTEYPLGTKVSYGSPVEYTTIGDSFDSLTVEVGCPNGLYYYNDSGVLVDYSLDYSVEISPSGMNDWTIITNSAASVANYSFNGRWSAGRFVWTSTTGPFIGYMTWTEVEAGSTYYQDHTQGEIHSVSGYITNTWQWKSAESVVVTGELVPYVTMTAAQRSIVRHVWRADNLTPGKYDIRITRLTEDQTDIRYSDDLYLLTVQEIVLDGFTYPGTALIGLRALATDQLSGGFSFECKSAGKLCRVYDGTNWTVVATSNPAWICWDILTEPIFADNLTVLSYRGYDPSQLDLIRWLEWAEYCDDLVPDGNGGTEPRLTYNGPFDANQSVWDAALSVAKIGRAVPYFRGQSITIAIDKPADPVALITVGNIGLDSFEETFLPLDSRAGSIEADFLNVDKELERDKFTVINPDAPVGWGVASLPLQGVIKPSEIWRHCRYYLATTLNLLRVVQVQMDIDSIAFNLGDVINVQHDVPMWGEGGRIISATSSTVTLDKSVTLVAGTTYSIMIRLLDNSLVERTISSPAGTYTTLTIATPFSTTPDPYDPYAFGPVELLVKPMRVNGIDPAGDLKRKITLTDYNATVYNADMMQPVMTTTNYSGLNLPTITGLGLRERIVKSIGGVITTMLDISWHQLPITSSMVKQIEVLVNGISIGLYAADATGTTAQVTDATTVTVHVRVIGWANNIQHLSKAATASKYIIGKTARPADVTGLTATTTTSGALRLDWLPVADLDIDYYEVAVSVSSRWSNSISVTKAYSSSITLPAAISGTYMVKAVDTSGLKSVNAASVVVAMPTDSYHTQQTLTESTSWAGLKTGCNVVAGKLELDVAGQWDGSQAVGYYYASQVIDLGSVQPARCLCSLDFLGIDTQLTWDDVVDVDAVPDVDLIGTIGNAEGCELQPQIALSQDGSSWGAWQPFTIGDYPARAFKFRLKLISTVITSFPQVSALQFKLLLPYRNQVMPDVVLPVTATTIALTPPFINKPAVKATIQNAQSGDTVAITGVTTSQFTIQVLNGGSGVARTVDIEATGT